MRLRLDPHIFLWFISGDPRLPTDWRESIRDADNEVSLSVVALWEAVVKHRLGQLPLPHPPEIALPTQRARHQMASLCLDEASVRQLAMLPLAHRDPLDRLLGGQALEYGLSIVTVDPVWGAYPTPLLDRTSPQDAPDGYSAALYPAGYPQRSAPPQQDISEEGSRMKCFIASAFGRDDVDAVYDHCVLPILKKLSITPPRVDRVEHNDDIDNKIIELLKGADFALVDLTYA